MALVSAFVLLLSVQLSLAQLEHGGKSETKNTNDGEVNKDSVVLSKLGDFFMDVDEAFSRFTAPKVDAEDRAKEQLYGRTQDSRSKYLGRIRENYRNIQKRIGSTLGLTSDVSILSEMFGINVQNKDGRSSINVDLPFMKLSTNTKLDRDHTNVESSTDTSGMASSGATSEQPKVAEFKNNVKVGDIKIDVESKSSDESPHVQVDIQPLQPRSSRPKLENENLIKKPSEYIEAEFERLNPNFKELDPLAKDASLEFYRREIEQAGEMQDTEDNSGVSGRILGDLLYSESVFDKIMKRVIKDSKWFLDSDLSPSKIFQRLNRFTQRVPQPSEPSNDLYRLNHDQILSSTLAYEPEDESEPEEETSDSETQQNQELAYEPMQYEINEVKTNQDGVELDFIPHPDSEDQNTEEDYILLAFTQQGVPLKLRMPEVDDPLGYLHETLTSADVSLNIPIQSYSDIEPVGSEILQLGSVDNGMLSQAIYVDLSDDRQLKSLLKSLKKFSSV